VNEWFVINKEEIVSPLFILLL